MYFIGAALIGLLPTWYRRWVKPCLYRQDITITPDPLAFNAQWVADGIAAAVQKCLSQDEALFLKLNCIQIARNHWQSYEVFLDVERHRVVVEAGAILDGRGRPVSGLSPQLEASRAEAALRGHTRLSALARTRVTTGSGVLLRLDRKGETGVIPRIVLGGKADRTGYEGRAVWFAWGLLVLIVWNLTRPYMEGPEGILDAARVLASSVVGPLLYEIVMRVRWGVTKGRVSAVFTPPG